MYAHKHISPQKIKKVLLIFAVPLWAEQLVFKGQEMLLNENMLKEWMRIYEV